MFRQAFKLRSALSLKGLLVGATSFTLFNYYQNYRQQQAVQCCGIVGIVSTKPIACNYCIEGIVLLQNRGYDSAGIASVDPKDGKILLTKYASDQITKTDCIDKLREMAPKVHAQAYTAIGHTRWATCGKKTDENAHPHCDWKDRVFLVHNGTIDNIAEIKHILREKNITLRSETDTELIAQLIGIQLEYEGKNLFDGIKAVIQQLEGTWGLVVVDSKFPNQMVVVRNGSPIQIGYDDDSIYVASEMIAFQKYTKNYISVQDNEMVMIDLNDRKNFVEVNKKREKIMKEIQQVQTEPNQPYHSFFEQETEEQPESILRAMGMGSRLSILGDTSKLGGLEPFKEGLLQIENLILVACGSSYYAGLFAMRYFKILNCFNTVQIIEASEFKEYDLPLENGGAIFISQSGETADIRFALECAKKNGLYTIGVVNVVGSQIASNVHCGVYLNSGREVSVPATKSFTNQIVVLLLIAIWFSHHKKIQQKRLLRKQMVQQIRQLPVCFGGVLRVVHDSCFQAGKILKDETHIYILGQGAALAIAKEGALKIKEVTYIHAEAFGIGELKHGPIALIESSINNKTKVILTILDNDDFDDMRQALVEVKSRLGYAIVITDCPERLQDLPQQSTYDFMIEITNLGELTPMLSLVVYQKIANQICVLNGINPDKPRNLAKTVTVK